MFTLSCIALFSTYHHASADPVPVTLSPPTNLVANAVSSSEIDLSWTPPTNLGGIEITGYIVERSTDDGATWETVSINTGNPDTAYYDTGLSSSTTYTYRISAITILVTSQPSDPVTATTQPPPSYLTVSSEDNTGTSIPGFFARIYKNGVLQASGYTPHTFTVNTGETYDVQIDTQYGNYVFSHWSDTGSSAYTRAISITSDKKITAVYNTMPQPPYGLTATASSTSQINLSWIAPQNNGGSSVTGYKVERSTDSGATWSVIKSNTANTMTAYSDSGLEPSTLYTYRVYAINAVGTSFPSTWYSVATDKITTASSIVLNMAQSTSETLSSSNMVTLANFDAGTGNNRLLVIGVSANSDVSSITYGGTSLIKSVSSFYNNDAELWYLKNPIGTGDIVVTMTNPTRVVVGAYAFSGVNQTVPIPTHVARHNTSPGSPSISITTKYPYDIVLDLPSIYGGVTLDSSTCMQEWNVNIPDRITGASSTAMEPSPGTMSCSWIASSSDYWDDVAVEINALGSSQVTPTTPSSPTGLAATTTSSSINLTWSAPTNDGGSAITGYRIERESPVGGGFTTLVADTGSTSTAYTDTGLEPNTQYDYRVSAINTVGASRPSSAFTVTTSSTSPSAPTSLAASPISSSRVDLTWLAPANNGGSQISGYKIERSSGPTWSVISYNTNTSATSYSDTGLAASTTYTYRVSAINSVGTGQVSANATATTRNAVHTITQIQSGLVASDSLTNETKTQQQLKATSRYWIFGGDAPDEGAPYDFFKDSSGLHIGAKAPSNGTWAGYFAVSPDTNAMLFHSIITTPVSSIPHQYFENGMYIQTSKPFINYVTCVSITGQSGTVWAVVSTTGNATQANQFHALYVDNSLDQPLTRDCTIITNGDNYLKVYLDGNMVYNNSTLNLQMSGPFNTYLEPQSSYIGKLLNGTYSDYYVSKGEGIKITNLPDNATRADLVDSTGRVLASSSVSTGIATFDVGKYHFPLLADIKVYDASNTLVAETSASANIYGGDTYSSN